MINYINGAVNYKFFLLFYKIMDIANNYKV